MTTYEYNRPPPLGAEGIDDVQHLFTAYYGAMLRVARRFVRTFDDAEEVIQDTWVAALSGMHRFSGRSAFKTWLFHILMNIARTRAKREARSISFSQVPEVAGDVTSPYPDPEQDVISGEVMQLITQAIAELPPRQQAVVRLHDVEGYGSDEICARLQLSPANHRVLLHRARAKVRVALAPRLDLIPT